MRKISLGLGFAALVASQAFWLGSTAHAAESLAPTASNLQLSAAEVLDISAIHREQRARGGEVELLWEDFSDAAFPPAGWSRHLLAGTASAQWARDTAESSSAPASAKRNWGSGAQDDWLVTPVVELGPGTNTLYFIDAGQWMEDYIYGGVWLSNGSCDPVDGDFVEVAEIDDTPGSSSAIVWRSAPVAIDLSGYAEQDVCLAFVYEGDFGATWWIDDIQVTNGDPLPPAQIGVDPATLEFTLESGEADSHDVSVMNLADAGAQDLEFTTTITRLVDGDAELTQSNSTSIVNSLGICGTGNPQTSTANNSFWRVFDLADHGITSDFSVTSIETGIGFNTASNAQTLNVYTVDGDFELANLTLLGSAGYTVAPADQATVIEVNFDLPVTVPAGSIMAIEQHIPASGGTYRAHVAANELGQTGDTYWSSTDCGAAYFEPQNLVDAISAPADLSWVLAVHGHEDDGSIVPTVTVVPDTGAIAGDSFLDLTVTADATGVVPDSRALYEYVMTIDSNDPVTPAVQIPVSVNVTGGGGGGGDPQIDVAPASLSASVAEGDTGADTLTIANTAALGSDALLWDIQTEPAMAGSGVPERLGTPAGINRSAGQQAQLLANEAARGSIVADSGFEAGSPNPFWDEASSNYGTLLCTIADCGTGTGTGPRTGTWWAWFGGIASAEIGYARQDVAIPSASDASLSFWVEQTACSGSGDDFLEVSLGGDVLWTTTADDPSCGSLGYREISLDISAYVGGTHTLEFYSELQGPDLSNFFVDDVAITTDAAPPAVCDAPSGLSWLSLSSANGSTDAGDSVQIDVTYDATGLAEGTYSGNLCVTSNDPANPLVVVPVEMEVTGGGGGANGIYYSSLLNKSIPVTLDGTTLNLVTETFNDTGPITGDWDVNFWSSGGALRFWTLSTWQARLAVDGTAVAMLEPGDTVGPATSFQASSGTGTPAAPWLAGNDGYVGIRFNCDGRLANPVPGTVCYGYIRLTTTGTTGFPATIVEYAYDGDGNAITIPDGGGGGDPEISVDPASISSVQDTNTSTQHTLDISNNGDADLTWTITEAGTASVTLDLSQGTGQPMVSAAAGASQLQAVPGTGAIAPAPRGGGDVDLSLDDGTLENNIGIGGTSQWLWFNRFTPDPSQFPFTLNEIQLAFDVATGTNPLAVGQAIDLYVYQDADGNPANGATHVGSLTGQAIQSLGAVNTYPVNIEVTGPGDVLIVAVMRYVHGSAHFPAAQDQSSPSQGRSWAGFGAPPADPPVFPSPTFGVIDTFGPNFIGNWMIRGYGSTGGGPLPEGCDAPEDISWLSVDLDSGTTGAGDTSQVEVTLDSTGLSDGSYEALLCIASNDAVNPLVEVPVSLTVATSAGNGDLVVSPGMVDIEVAAGESASTVVTLSNEGSAAIDWTVIPDMATVLSEDFEGAFPAAGWTLEDNSSTACPWFQTNGSSMSGFVPGPDGSLGAAIDADDCGSGQTYDSSLISPELDLTGYGQAILTFDLSYRHLSTPNLNVDVSTDGGSTWTTVQGYSSNTGYTGAPVAQEIDLSAYGGQTIHLRWHWTSGWTWWAFIDNVELIARDSANWPMSCWDPSVDWLDVTPTSGTVAVAGSQAVTLDVVDSLEPGTYGTELCIANDNGSPLDMVVVPVEVTVTAPEITVDPTAISAAADPGDSVSQALTIGNIGNGALVYTLDEAPAGASNPRAHFPSTQRAHGGQFDANASAVAEQVPAEVLAKLQEQALMGDGQVSRAQVFGRGGRGGAQVPAYSNTGWANTDYVTLDALVPGVLTSIVDPQVNTIYAATFLDNDFSRQFFIAGTPGDGAALPLGTYGYLDTATGAPTQLGVVSNTPAGANWISATQDPTTGIVYATANSAAGNQLFTVDPATGVTTLVGPITGANIVIAIAVSPEGLMYGLDIGTDTLLAIDKTSGAMSVIGALGPDANFAQDMDFDQSTGVLYWAGYHGGGNSQMYTVDTGTGAASLVGPIQDGAELLSFSIAVAGGNCSDPADVPWLSLDSAGGTIPAGGADHAVGVTLDAAGLSDGVYEASICVRSNDPSRSLVEVPVEFVVGSPALGTDLALNLFSVPGTVHAGDNVSLIASVANFGPNPATDVVVALALPDEFSFLSGRVIEGSGDWSCSAAGADVTCELVSGALPVGEFAAVLRVDVDVDALAEDGPVTTVGVVSNAGGDPNPANDEATAVTTIIGAPGDSIFANGFECAPGYPDCGPGEGEPGIYDDRADFLANVLGGHYEEGFDNVPLNLVEDPMLFSQDGFSYSVYSALPYNGEQGGLWNGPGFISLNSANDQIEITFTSGNVSAVGGNFWATDIDFNATGTSVVFQLSNGTSHTVDVTSASTFTGFVTESTITSITIDAPDVPANAWSTMDNLIVGTR